MNCGSSKAPSPDGFNFFFYKKTWTIIKSHILFMFRDFNNTSKLPKGTNFLVLGINSQDYRHLFSLEVRVIGLPPECIR